MQKLDGPRTSSGFKTGFLRGQKRLGFGYLSACIQITALARFSIPVTSGAVTHRTSCSHPHFGRLAVNFGTLWPLRTDRQTAVSLPKLFYVAVMEPVSLVRGSGL